MDVLVATCNESGVISVLSPDSLLMIGVPGAVSGSSETTVAGSSGTTVAGSSGNTVAGSSGNTVAGSSGTAVAGSSEGAALRVVREAAAAAREAAAARAAAGAAAAARADAAARAAAALDAEPSVEGMAALVKHREKILDTTGYTQEIIIVRADLIGDCIALTMSESFINSIQRSLVVKFLGEEGIDGGSLLDDVFGLVLRHFEPFLEANYVQEETDDVILYAAGVWSGNYVYNLIMTI